MDNDKLTMVLLQEIKRTAKRWFIAFLVVLGMLFVSNLTWLYAWCLPTESVTVEQDGEGTNNYIGDDGDITNGAEN